MNSKIRQIIESSNDRFPKKRTGLYKLIRTEYRINSPFYTHRTKIDLSGKWSKSWHSIADKLLEDIDADQSKAQNCYTYVLVTFFDKADVIENNESEPYVMVQGFAPHLARALTISEFGEYAQVRSPLDEWGKYAQLD
jgi:hypothetical protein